MSTTIRPTFNRTRNSTRRPSSGNGTSSNSSNYTSQHQWLDESPEILFYLLTSLIIPSIVCFIFIFHSFIRLPVLRVKSSNLLIICLLIVNFVHMLIDLPIRLYFFHENEVPFRNSFFCLFWTWSDAILTAVDLFIMAFASIERYIFVFRHILLRNHYRLLYQLPMVLCFAIPIIWYTVLIFGYPCQQTFSYFTFQCGTACYLTNTTVFTHVENIGFFMIPLFVIVVGNGTLIFRVLLQKKNMKQRHRLSQWRNNFRMIGQLAFIGILYMSVYVPSCILLIFGNYVRRGRFLPWAAEIRTRYFIHLKYLVIFGCPFVVLAGQKEMHQMLKNIFSHITRRQTMRWRTNVQPLTLLNTQNRRENEQKNTIRD
ncbi:unnamed protein product [Adineta ricciae]|uniref:G-protein coupled receptors family 1 profile domain-containing protein n=2 Tax=Adineta ricciae TaxID=249248 RepID=A0A815BC51_ADIRI|nr:unnamed protein product [Adineta ricciae]